MPISPHLDGRMVQMRLVLPPELRTIGDQF